MDRQSTHWEGCHEHHPECASCREGFKAGREAGMREAAAIVGTLAERPYDTNPEFDAILHAESAILAEADK